MNNVQWTVRRPGMERQGWLSRMALCIVHCTLFITHYSLAQLNSWQSHVSYRSAQSVAVVENKIYAATRNGFFYYDKSTNETVTLGKQDGLSDVGISRLLYLGEQKRLLIAYQNGNLDFMSVTNTGEPGSVKNVSIIRTAPNLPVARSINHLNRVGRNVYLSANFGLVVFDIVNDEIRDTYFTEPEIITYATAIANDSLYALTSPPNSRQDYDKRRLRATRLNPTVNIADPANWRPVPAPDIFMRSLIADRGRLYVSVDNKGVYERQNGNWVLTQSVSSRMIRLFPTPNGPLLATEQAITLPNSTRFTGPLLINPVEVAADGDRVWVADAQAGLLAGKVGAFERIAPEGPVMDGFTYLYAYPQTLIASSETSFDGPHVELYSVPNGRWQGITTNDRYVGFRTAVYLPAEQRLYLGGGGGLWSQTNEQPLQPVVLPNTISPNAFINSLATDLDGNLWIGTGGSNGERASLYVRRADGTVQAFLSANQFSIKQIVTDDNGFLWLISDGNNNELVVFDPRTNQRRSFYITSRALAKDRTGVIWIGTDQGPLVFDNPSAAFDLSTAPQPPLLNGRRLLANEIVTSIAVDGGNAKWIGTRTGLYHVAPDGSQLLDSFTADNSPLPDNIIQALAIEPVSGRVFVQTDRGIISYRGPATEPAETLNLGNVTIFPNPVRPDFSGTVGINGLTNNATMKVLDAGGQLVYETRSQGGTATWDLRDYRNRPAQTGIYLIVIVSANGTEGLAGKLAVVR